MAGVEYAAGDDDTSIAFRVLEPHSAVDTRRDIVLVLGGFMPIEVLEDEPGFVRLLEGLRGLGRVVVFDRRGVGLSDPISDWDRPVLDQWADDVATVVRAVGVRDVVVVSLEGYGVGSRFVARNPQQVDRLVIFDPIIVNDDEWDAFSKERHERVSANMRGEWDVLQDMAPSKVGNPSFREWFARAGRTGASPATARRVWESVLRSRPSEQLLEQIAAPTLVLHRRGNKIVPPGASELAGSLIPDATLVEVEGTDAFAFTGDVDSLVAEIAEFLVGERRVPAPERVLSAVMFTDIVGSTERAVSVGDAQWKSLLDRHDRAVRVRVSRCGGTVVKTTGDGVLALFPSASSAIEAGRRLRAELADDELRLRVGVHVGEVDRRGDDVSGVAVNVAARVMGLAPDDGIAVTETVVTTMTGQATRFEPLGAHELKGVPGLWPLSCVVDHE